VVQNDLEPQWTHSLKTEAKKSICTRSLDKTCENCSAALSAETPRNRISSRRKPTQKRGAINERSRKSLTELPGKTS